MDSRGGSHTAVARSRRSMDSLGARYYAPQLGRFLTPDWSEAPKPIPYAALENPQSLNLYSYVLNNPVTSLDRDGHVRTDDSSNLAAWAPMDEDSTAESLFGDEFGRFGGSDEEFPEEYWARSMMAFIAGSKFASADLAAEAAIKASWEIAQKTGWEWGGNIFERK